MSYGGQVATANDVKIMLKGMKNKLTQQLPKGVTTEKFQQTVILAVERNPFLLKLDQASLREACQLAAADGLILDGREAALVPFKGKVKYIPMYQGLLKKMRNSGEVSTVFCDVVARSEYDNGLFEYFVDMDGQKLKHAKDLDLDLDKGGDLFCAYMYAKMKDGSVQIEVMSGNRIRAIKDKQLSQINENKRQYSPWVTSEAEMWKKTVFRAGSKWLPSSTDLNRLYRNDDEASGIHEEIDVTPKEQPKSAIEGLLEENGGGEKVSDGFGFLD